MRILLIAPVNPDIPDIATAAQAICSLHQCEIIQATDTTHREIVEKAKIGGYDTIWLFGQLSGGGGFALPNHEELTTEQIVSTVQVSSARLAVLFVCRSFLIAQQILERTKADVIFTMDTVLAPDALWSATVLAHWLQSHPIKTAYQLAQLGEKFFYGENYSRRVIDAMNADPQTSSQLDRLYTMIEGLRREVANIDKSVAALQASVTAMNNRLERIERDSNRNDRSTTTQLSLSQIIFVIVVGLAPITITGYVLFAQSVR